LRGPVRNKEISMFLIEEGRRSFGSIGSNMVRIALCNFENIVLFLH